VQSAPRRGVSSLCFVRESSRTFPTQFRISPALLQPWFAWFPGSSLFQWNSVTLPNRWLAPGEYHRSLPVVPLIADQRYYGETTAGPACGMGAVSEGIAGD
jgi:hypothetical protein